MISEKSGILLDEPIRIFTIGLTKTSAEHFFSRLTSVGVKKLIDVRLNNVSQLAGFAKKDDLRYFLREICDIEYEYRPEPAPTREMPAEYRSGRGNWQKYEERFLNLMAERRVEEEKNPYLIQRAFYVVKIRRYDVIVDSLQNISAINGAMLISSISERRLEQVRCVLRVNRARMHIRRRVS